MFPPEIGHEMEENALTSRHLARNVKNGPSVRLTSVSSYRSARERKVARFLPKTKIATAWVMLNKAVLTNADVKFPELSKAGKN